MRGGRRDNRRPYSDNLLHRRKAVPPDVGLKPRIDAAGNNLTLAVREIVTHATFSGPGGRWHIIEPTPI